MKEALNKELATAVPANIRLFINGLPFLYEAWLAPSWCALREHGAEKAEG
jgi:hypothetical protein